MRSYSRGERMLASGLSLWVCIVFLLIGCTVDRKAQEKVRDLDFTVVGEGGLPEELKELVEGKKAEPFRLTWSNDQGLYIAVGYGEQPSGGYSIRVNELYLTENAIVLDTELLGPEQGAPAGTEKSYPYLVVQTEYLETPVIFQ